MAGSDTFPALPPETPWIELVYESQHTRVTRRELPEIGAVICKEPLGIGRAERLRHEQAVLERLHGVPGVAQLVEGAPFPDAITVEDVGGVPLAAVRKPTQPAEVIRLGLELARTVAEIHGRGVLHRNLIPANILVIEPRRTPIVIDFGLATTFTEVRPEFIHHSELAAALPYLAPEQTGHTGRPVDQRADLYALGAVLYECATGRPPFEATDPLRRSHEQLTRQPIRPSALRTTLPTALSDVIMRLLATEPDDRYQTAEGLAHDLAELREDPRARLTVGTHDFPARLRPPSRLVGRDRELATLAEAFAGATTGHCRGVVVSGRSGVGKSTLVDELRPIAAANNGWFVAGKFDQYRRDQEFDAVRQAFRSLARLLLAEPEAELAEVREQLRAALGDNAELLVGVVPEFGAVLDLPAATKVDDPLTAQARVQRTGIEALRVIATPKRPVVMVVDDLQWASRTPHGFVDLVMNDEHLDGLLLACAYRSSEVDPGHPLAAMLERWRHDELAVERIDIADLSEDGLSGLVADVLRLPPEPAAELAALLYPQTHGNPYRTMELLNVLRQRHQLTVTSDGWRWDREEIGRHVRTVDVAELLGQRTAALQPETRHLLEAMACLGGQVELPVLATAVDSTVPALLERLSPALEEGLITLSAEGGEGMIAFRHDLVRDTLLQGLGADPQRTLRLRLARALAGRSEWASIAADQYLPVIGAVQDPAERIAVAELLRAAARQNRLLINHQLVERCLVAAIPLIPAADRGTLRQVQIERHAALFNLGRLPEADEVYQQITELCGTPAEAAPATLIQITSLTHRNHLRGAIALAVETLRRFGCAVPDDPGPEIEQLLDEMYAWAADPPTETLPVEKEPDKLIRAALLERMLAATYLSGHPLTAWVCLTAWHLWVTDGPRPALAGPIGQLPFVTIAARDDYRTGDRVARRLLGTPPATDFGVELGQGRLRLAMTSAWLEPVEASMREQRLAREELLHGGDVANATYTYLFTAFGGFDVLPTLSDVLAEVDAGIAFARRSGNEQVGPSIEVYRQMLLRLRGGTSVRTELAPPDAYQASPQALFGAHFNHALAATFFDDQAALARHSSAAMAAQRSVTGSYQLVTLYAIRALAVAQQVRAAAVGSRSDLLAELDRVIGWIAGRAADSPDNFSHLLRLAEAERAWATGDFQAASYAYDAAIQQVRGRPRPWHRALITERAARFCLAHGMEFTGQVLLARARRGYAEWGAAAKVDQLDWAYPALRSVPDELPEPAGPDLPVRRSTLVAGRIDLLGVLAASQALSSETSIDGLRDRVTEILSSMTGATGVHVVLWDEAEERWLATLPDAEGGTIPAEDAPPGELPMAPLRYAERTREPLVVDDAVHDDRFRRDPYFARLERCSLLAAPVLNRGRLTAMLLLENRLLRGAFAGDRLDGVMLIAGQLAVSVDNATVYASLERRVTERTEELARANERLAALSVTDALTGLANRRRLEEVLSAEWLRATRNQSPVAVAMIDIDHFKPYNDHYGHAAGDRRLQRVAALLREHVRDVDLVARYGGEEFAVVMPETELPEALQVAERLRVAVRASAEPHRKAPEQVLTVSVGVAAAWPSERCLVDRLIEQADIELYRAKRGGRDQVRPAAAEAARAAP